MKEELSDKDILDLYEGGKNRRYGLLFSVNGGAFVIGTILLGTSTKPAVPLGWLTPLSLAFSLIFFNAVMWFDIWQFGNKMRRFDKGESLQIFGSPGKWVLSLLCVMLMGAWTLVILPTVTAFVCKP
jgi:hypothetical protein